MALDFKLEGPFSAVTVGIAVNPALFQKMLAHITGGCGHKHHLALALDNPWPIFYVSESGAKCMEKVRW